MEGWVEDGGGGELSHVPSYKKYSWKERMLAMMMLAYNLSIQKMKVGGPDGQGQL